MAHLEATLRAMDNLVSAAMDPALTSGWQRTARLVTLGADLRRMAGAKVEPLKGKFFTRAVLHFDGAGQGAEGVPLDVLARLAGLAMDGDELANQLIVAGEALWQRLQRAREQAQAA